MSALSCQKNFSQEGAEKQAQLERSLREKAAVEKELEKVSFTPQGTYLSCSQWYFAFVELGKHASERASERESHLARGDVVASRLLVGDELCARLHANSPL